MLIIKPRVILSAFMLVAGLTILSVGCVLFSWYSWGAEKECALLGMIGLANVLGAWKFWRLNAGSQATRRWQLSALSLMPALTVYLAGYAFLGYRVCGFEQNGARYCGFVYRHAWESRLFVPAAIAESLVFQRNIAIATEDELVWVSPVREVDQLVTTKGAKRP
jgi:hypothetical protein